MKAFIYLILGLVIGGAILANMGTTTLPEAQNTGCTRESLYTMPSEFIRALSLIQQRFKAIGLEYPVIDGFVNCLNIQYADLKNGSDGAEGVFYFDSNVSSVDNLVIEVDNSYQANDDLLTAMLLVHETTHVEQFLKKVLKGGQTGCVDMEVDAFMRQVRFFTFVLNNEERESLAYRFLNEEALDNSGLDIMKQLFDMAYSEGQKCSDIVDSNERAKCGMDGTEQRVREMVESNPYYQQQCGL